MDLAEEEQALTDSMAALRVVVEWGYKQIRQFFSSLDSKRKLKVQEGPVAQAYQAALLLWNIHCCMYGGQTATVSPLCAAECRAVRISAFWKAIWGRRGAECGAVSSLDT